MANEQHHPVVSTQIDSTISSWLQETISLSRGGGAYRGKNWRTVGNEGDQYPNRDAYPSRWRQLINHATHKATDWPGVVSSISSSDLEIAFNDLEDQLDREFDQYQAEMAIENSDRIQFLQYATKPIVISLFSKEWSIDTEPPVIWRWCQLLKVESENTVNGLKSKKLNSIHAALLVANREMWFRGWSVSNKSKGYKKNAMTEAFQKASEKSGIEIRTAPLSEAAVKSKKGNSKKRKPKPKDQKRPSLQKMVADFHKKHARAQQRKKAASENSPKKVDDVHTVHIDDAPKAQLPKVAVVRSPAKPEKKPKRTPKPSQSAKNKPLRVKDFDRFPLAHSLQIQHFNREWR